jgi:glutamate/aspartate transport system substrate-binding protein
MDAAQVGRRHPTQSRRAAACLLVAGVLMLAPGAAPDGFGQELAGTLKKVKDRGTIALGYRENSFPFSFVDKRGAPHGYSIDLCLALVDEVRAELERDTIKVVYVPVTPADRIDKVVDGSVDIECGSTTNNVERQKRVAFSPVIFVSGTKLLVRRTSAIKSYRDLRGKTVVLTAGTTNEKAMRLLSDHEKLDMKFLTAPDHADSFRMLASGQAHAFATDDVLLYGFVSQAARPVDYAIVGDFLSFDPYGLMFRKDDPEFSALVLRTFQDLAASRELADLYDKWFMRKLRTGERLGLPMSAQLKSIFEVLGQPE